MKASGELNDNKVIFKKQKDIGRLYTKSHFGKLISNNYLELDLVESVFLLAEGKIKIFQEENEIHFQDLVKIAAQKISDFEIKYLVFRDLRKRGYSIKSSKDKEFTTFYQFKQKKEMNGKEKQYFISAFSERDYLYFDDVNNMIKESIDRNGNLWFGIVDEEGDITYYDVSSFDIKGSLSESTFPKGKGFLLKNRIVLFDKTLSEELQKKEFYGKPFGDGLQLSLIESLHLSEKDIIDVLTVDGKKISKNKLKNTIYKLQPDIELRFIVFKDLKKRGFIVKTGFKYGAHFRAYTKHIDKTHAEYLVHVIEKQYKGTWAEMSRAIRLSHSVNKEFVFARFDGDVINYIKLGRLRP